MSFITIPRLVRLYVILLAVYTGIRTYDFIFSQLPMGLSDMAAWSMALVFLGATEIGMFMWHEVSNNHCTTETQKTISDAMTWIDFAASLAAGLADMIMWQTLTVYELDPIFAKILIFGIPITLALNVAAGLAFLSKDGDTIIRTEERLVTFEANKQAIQRIRKNRQSLAANLAVGIQKRMEQNILDTSDATIVEDEETHAIRVVEDMPEITGNGHKKSVRNFLHR